MTTGQLLDTTMRNFRVLKDEITAMQLHLEERPVANRRIITSLARYVNKLDKIAGELAKVKISGVIDRDILESIHESNEFFIQVVNEIRGVMNGNFKYSKSR